jgi:soluble lytic murein transglycosylase-like protein
MKREITYALVVLALLLLPCLPASADIYQYTDENGVVHFSNVDVGKTKKFTTVKAEPREALTKEPAKHIPGPVKATSSAVVPTSYFQLINSASYKHGVDPSLVHAIIKVESDYNPYAMSKKGAMGLMQLMPQTALELNVKNSFSPAENIYGGVKYLRYLMDRYEGNLSLALAAYNAGETMVKRWGTIPPIRETQNYVKRILTLYNGTGGTFAPRYTIFIGYSEDGALLLTDNPSKHQKKKQSATQDL